MNAREPTICVAHSAVTIGAVTPAASVPLNHTLRGGGLPLALILAGSFVLNVTAIGWGMPSASGWAPDETLPQTMLAGIAQRFSGGWVSTYPAFHHYVLTLAYLPTLALEWLRGAPIDLSLRHVSLVVSGRMVSVFMATATLAAIYLVAAEAFGRRCGAFRRTHPGPDDTVCLLRQDDQRGRPVRVLVCRLDGPLHAAAAGAATPRLRGVRGYSHPGHLHERSGVRAVCAHTDSDRHRPVAERRAPIALASCHRPAGPGRRGRGRHRVRRRPQPPVQFQRVPRAPAAADHLGAIRTDVRYDRHRPGCALGAGSAAVDGVARLVRRHRRRRRADERRVGSQVPHAGVLSARADRVVLAAVPERDRLQLRSLHAAGVRGRSGLCRCRPRAARG